MSLEGAGENAIEADDIVCAHCSRPFVRESHLALHRGLEHSEAMDSAEREAFEAARTAETEELRLFRLKAIFVLVCIYFGFLIVYALVI